MIPQVTNTALRHLDQAALQIHVALHSSGIDIDANHLQSILIQWLESSIESLCEDACELCLTGDRTYASFNRDVFDRLLNQIHSAL